MQAWAAALSTACDWLSGGKKPVGDNSVLEGWPFQRESDKGAGVTWVWMRTDRGAGSPKPPPNGRHHIFLFFFFPREKNKAGLQYWARVQRTIKSPSASHIRDKVNRPDKVVAATRWWAQTILVQISQPHDSSLLFSTGAWKALCLVQRLCRWEEWN